MTTQDSIPAPALPGSTPGNRELFNASQWLVDRHVENGLGGRVAIRCQGRSTTYDELQDLVRKAATGLRRLGVGPEDRVAMVLLDGVEFVVTFLAALRIGAVPLLTNPLLPARDLALIIADSRARLLVISNERRQLLGDLLAEAPEISRTVLTPGNGTEINGQEEADVGRLDTTGLIEWDLFVADHTDAEMYETWYESPGFWLCTSGTTGLPKLAMHRHGDIPYTCQTYADQVLAITEDDRFFSVGPMFHAYGLGNSLTFPLSVGATAILEPTRPPTTQRVAELLTAEQPTLFFCIPTFYAALTNAGLPKDTFASVRFGVSAAESLPAETFLRFRDQYGVTILDGIGSTEMLHIFLSNRPDQLSPGTSGQPVPGYDCRVIDDDGIEVGHDVPGQLVVQGESSATGYWCRTDVSRDTFQGPWTHTGDLYVKSADGYFTYLGRTDDMLRVGGEWVSPAEVESVLIEHAAVLEAAVVGERDDRGILRPIAHVIPSGADPPSADDLTVWCRDRLAGYKRPTRYVMVDDLPKTATGKIQRFKLRS